MYPVHLLLVFGLVGFACALPRNLPWTSLIGSENRNEELSQVEFHSSTEFEQKWKAFKINHEKSYKDDKEEQKRKKIFAENLKEIEDHNKLYVKELTTYTKGVNQFADLTKNEFIKQISCFPSGNLSQILSETGDSYRIPKELFPAAPLPAAVDWRSRGIVSRVKNQGSCGSCWAFSATGALEGQLLLKTREPVTLSEQNLVDCSRRYYNYGCSGGFPHRAFQYIKVNDGIDSEDSYQYEAENGVCRYNPKTRATTVKDYVAVYPGSEELLQRAVAYIGPVAVAVDATNWQFYESGIFRSNENNRNLNHAVLAVGYNTNSPGKDYWIIKNSWGTKWGMDGYLLLPRNKDNQCGIGEYGTYPVIS